MRDSLRSASVPRLTRMLHTGLDQLTPALEALMARETWGKVVLRVRADPQNPPKGKSNL